MQKNKKHKQVCHQNGKNIKIFVVLFMLSVLCFLSLKSALALSEVCSKSSIPFGDLDRCIGEIEREVAALKPAQEKNEKELADLKKQLSGLQAQIKNLTSQVNSLEKDIREREEDLVLQQELLEQRIRSFYIRSRQYSPIVVFLASSNATEFTRELVLRSQAASEDKRIIEELATNLVQLKEDKSTLENSRAGLQRVQVQIDSRAQFLEKEVAKVGSYLASLSAKQQSFIAQKLGSLNLPATLGAGPLFCVDDRDAKYDPGFRPAFAFFTYGIPHRVGMNQYGALGRAKAGQSAERILQAYFQNIEIAGGFEGRTVKINGTNEFGQTFNNEDMNVEEYLKHLHEMPARWKDEGGFEALKAQAVAARSYALSEMNAKGFVYPSQKDQVIKKELNDGRWQEAVVATSGKIAAQGGQPIKAWYASTSGGYTFTSADIWGGSSSWTKRLRDTSAGVGGFADLASTSYDKESPCFYAAQGSRAVYNKSAWLKSDEVADIANTILLARADASTREHLYQTDKPNPNKVDTWNADRVKQELQSRGITPFNSVSGASVSVDFDLGKTTAITISGDRSESFDGDEFKDYFNLRTPANIQIVGPLFNVETR